MQTVGAKRYFLSLAFSFRNSAKTFATKNAHAGTRGTKRSPSDVSPRSHVADATRGN